MSKTKNPLKEAIRACTANQDMFIYSGGISKENVETYLHTVASGKNKDRLTLLLTTNGGDAHAAYRMGRYLQTLYEYIRVLVVGPCKSAGTLLALSANELAFGPSGELGPLDVQIAQRDELFYSNSGLDTMQAFTLITGHCYAAFENYMLQTIVRSGGTVSFTRASEIAAKLATGFIAPIAAQIDPHRLGEVERMMEIATAYGERLATENVKEGTIRHLVNGYPSHGFIIDVDEAKTLFNSVSIMTMEEMLLVTISEKLYGACCTAPSSGIVSLDVRLIGTTKTQEGNDDEAAEDNDNDGEGAERPKPVDTKKPGENPTARGRRKAKPNSTNGAETAQ